MSEPEAGHVVLHGARAPVLSATLHLYHLSAPEADWNLDVVLAGPTPRLLLSGTAVTPVLPGPGALRLAYVDAPEVVVVSDRRGGLTNGGRDLCFEVSQAGDRVRIAGVVELEWFDFTEGSASYSLELALDAVVAGARE